MTKNDLISAAWFLRRVVPRGLDEENELVRLILMFEGVRQTEPERKAALNGMRTVL